MSVDYSTLTYEMLIPNNKKQIFNDVRTRQAIMYAIDTSIIAKNIYMDMVMESEVPVITGSWLYEPQSAVYYKSPERALMLLKEAGWGDYNGDGILDKVVDGILVQLEFTITTCVDDAANTRAHAAELISDQLKILGISINVSTVSKSTLQKRLKNRDFEMVLCGMNLSIMPDLTFLLDSEGRMNYSGYSSAEMNKLLDGLRKTTDETEFKSVMSQIQLKIAEDLPFMGLFFRKGTLMTTSQVSGLGAIIEGDVFKGFEYIEFLETR
jgi:peptide/nickel transport system substrate-binding protein